MIEIIASSLSDAIAIERAGADRIELVSALSEGGYTPSIGLVQAILSRVKTPLAVMLRPNKADFQYTTNELEVLRRDAVVMERIGVKHVVLGILSPEGLPDIRRMEQVLEGTNLELTFHRAIDSSANPLTSLRYLNSYDRVTHILTSGGPGKAPDNLDMIEEMLKLSTKRIIIGSGVDLSNAKAIQERFKDYSFDIHVGGAVRGGDVRATVSEKEVRQLIENLRQG